MNILFLDWRLSQNKIGSTLSSELNSSIFNLGNLLKEQLRNNDSLGKEMTRILESGEMLTTEIIGRFISKNLKEVDRNVLFLEYPRTIEQFDGLKKVLTDENIELENIWYFKQREPKEFMTNHFKNPIEKQWLDKYGDEVIEKWKIEFTRRREQIAEIQNVTDKSKWKIIEMDYIKNLNSEYITRRIKDCA
ncbi:nucleoside monophosphate kinase [Winogradskyella immobilis]|uniref:Nucleoside monophosphate kinase n=1 Tax=Winogradskyella immobilis TaxID=2816852 RepID=A0ABS8ES57_9FLAO|nr:nucleoside monophosphate kinase [Winogradskyella immobilis]MCC1485360.1 nucleoside monophosphate kinase [Winogradskyella immobilis]MCG0017452.1 nucleoside monophosphate kinase [Winogradskyella immobilis]